MIDTGSRLWVTDFASLLGVDVDALPASCVDLVERTNFGYTTLQPTERDSVIVDILRQIDGGRFDEAGPSARAKWESAWSANMSRFIEHGHDVARLTPEFLAATPVLRISQEYARPSDPGLEAHFLDVIRLYVAETYFTNADAVYEFGCGSGFNLAILAALFPDKRLIGLDWSQSSVDLVNLIGKTQKANVEGRRFDFFSPGEDIVLDAGSAVLTIAALEQVGDDHGPFLRFLRDQSPDVCVHIEPILAFYDDTNLVDYLAIRYHRARNYLQGYLTELRRLEQAGEAEILTARRLYFGSLYHEAYSLIVWRPS